MSVVIRLRRTGRKNLPCYRINVADSRFPRDGRMLETIGLYDPLRRDPAQQVVVNAERAKHWIDLGAEVSEIVASILRRKGLKDLLRRRVMRERPGRGKKTKTRAARDARDERLQTAKDDRRKARLVARRAAQKAAAASEAKS